MNKLYRIENPFGLGGKVWNQVFHSYEEAKEALLKALGWEDAYFSHWFYDDNFNRTQTAWYTVEDMEHDGWGEDTARIIEVLT